MGDAACALTVCVIGRNEAKNLPRLIASLRPLRAALGDSEAEFIFVDSASADASAEIAATFFDDVFVLSESPRLSASAGRWVGTRMASGAWVLYLDGDMELLPEFVPFVVETVRGVDSTSGWVGLYTHRFHDGAARHDVLRGPGRRSGEPVRHFGGAVLLPADCVRDAGNWNPALFANEELDLHERLRARGVPVRFVDVPLIDHHTPRRSLWSKIVDEFLPSPRRKKSLGFGQLLAARLQQGTLLRFALFFPYPFVVAAGGALMLMGAALGHPMLILGAGAAAAAFVSSTRGARFVPVCVGLVIQGLVGARHYRPFTPSFIRFRPDERGAENQWQAMAKATAR
jgi:glycosyltransferase involved in cell wall biosynthesis